MTTTLPRSSSLLFSAWFAAAVVLSLLVPPPLLPAALRPLVILGPVALLTPFVLRPAMLNPRLLTALHIVRLPVGLAFLLLAGTGVPREFGVPAGIGDMIAGAGALLLVLAWPKSRWVHLVWNFLGLADFLNVQRIVFALGGRSTEFPVMMHPPLAFVPFVAVPLLFSIHLHLLSRHARS